MKDGIVSQLEETIYVLENKLKAIEAESTLNLTILQEELAITKVQFESTINKLHSVQTNYESMIVNLSMVENNFRALETESARNLKIVKEELEVTKEQFESTMKDLHVVKADYESKNNNLISSEYYRKVLEVELQQQNAVIEKIIESNSWRLTRPLRLVGRLIRGEFELVYISLVKDRRIRNIMIYFKLVKNALKYISNNNLKGFLERIEYYKKKEYVLYKRKSC